MRSLSLLALTLAVPGVLHAQLTNPVSRAGEGVDVGEALPLPSQIVAAQISAALADPRNQAHLDSVESTLAGLGTTSALTAQDEGVPEDGTGSAPGETEAAVAATMPEAAGEGDPGLLAGVRGGATAKEADPSAAAGDQSGDTSASGSVTASGAMIWFRTRMAESRAVALRAATVARSRIGELGLPRAVPWTIALSGALLLLGLAAWRVSRPAEDKSLKRARKLARRGVGVAEVARRTGLSRDLIQLIEARRNRKEEVA